MNLSQAGLVSGRSRGKYLSSYSETIVMNAICCRLGERGASSASKFRPNIPRHSMRILQPVERYILHPTVVSSSSVRTIIILSYLLPPATFTPLRNGRQIPHFPRYQFPHRRGWHRRHNSPQHRWLIYLADLASPERSPDPGWPLLYVYPFARRRHAAWPPRPLSRTYAWLGAGDQSPYLGSAATSRWIKETVVGCERHAPSSSVSLTSRFGRNVD